MDDRVTGESFDDDVKDKEPATGGKALGPWTERRRPKIETASRRKPSRKIAMLIQRVSLSCLSLMRRHLTLFNFDGIDLGRGIGPSLVLTMMCVRNLYNTPLSHIALTT